MKVYYIGGNNIKEVDLLYDSLGHHLIRDSNGATYDVSEYAYCYSKEEAINKVLENLKYEVKQYEDDLYYAQDGLSMAKDNLKNFKEKYNL